SIRQPDQIGAVDDIVDMALQRSARPRQLRVLVLKPEQVAHDGAAFRTIVAREHGRSAQMQFFDGRKTRKTECLARDNNDKRQRGGKGKSRSNEAEAFASREKTLDQVGHAQPETEQGQST